MDPGKFLAEINRSLHAILERTDEPTLATAEYLGGDVDERDLRFASAGHPSPIRLRRDAGLAEPLKFYDSRHGPALGLFEKSTYPVCHCPIAVNDLLFLFTHGLYEVEGSEGAEFGVEALLTAVRQRVRLPAETLFEELLGTVQSFAG